MNDDDVEREARQALGRRALEEKGPRVHLDGGLGGSPVAPMEQLRLAALTLMRETLPDGDGALHRVFEQDIRQEEALFGPLALELVAHTTSLDVLHGRLLGVLGALAKRPLSNDEALAEFTRRVDAEWGKLFSERPHFQAVGQVAHPDDVYTHQSVRAALTQLVAAAGQQR
jgi:hypothetical protein